MKSGTKQSRTKRSIKNFEEWNELRYRIRNNSLEEIEFDRTERFIPIFDYNIPDFNKNYYVSESANLLSFKQHGTGSEKVKILKPKPIEGSGYVQIGDNWRLHRLVWFSFAADAIQRNDEDAIDSFGLGEVRTIKQLKKLAKAGIDIHHKDGNPLNNDISNLQALPPDIHAILTAMGKKPEEEQFDYFVEKKAVLERNADPDNAIVILHDDVGSCVYEAEPDGCSWYDSMQKMVSEINMDVFMYNIVKSVCESAGVEYFNKDRHIHAELEDGFVLCRIHKSGNELEVIQIRNLLTAPEDPDILWKQGTVQYFTETPS